MNLLFVMLQVVGLASLGLSSLKTLDSAGDLSVAARLVLLSIVFFAAYAAFEALAARTPTRPGITLLVFACGLYAAFRAFAPLGRSILDKGPGWHWNKPQAF